MGSSKPRAFLAAQLIAPQDRRGSNKRRDAEGTGSGHWQAMGIRSVAVEDEPQSHAFRVSSKSPEGEAGEAD